MCLLKYTVAAGLLHTYIAAYIKETHSLSPLQDFSLQQTVFKALHHDVKVGYKSCRGVGECVSCVHVYSYVYIFSSNCVAN